MANLKGSDHDRQIYDALYRLEARGEGRTGEARNDALNHSHAVVEKRTMVLKDFSRYTTEKGLEGKLNQLMTRENVTEFLRARTDGLKSSSTEGYVSNFSALVKGLASKNITIPVAGSDRAKFFAELKNELGRTDHKNFEKGRYIAEDRAKEIISTINTRSSAIAELQYMHGFRASEAREIVNHSEKYLKENTIELVKGKGGQPYRVKEISNELKEKIERSTEIISKGKYYRDIEKVIEKNRAHDLRVTFSIDNYSNLRTKGMSDREAKKETTEEINHHRGSMTEYYQARG
ncbi:hypothetical protein [Sulfuricurvum sp.]|uniref:hypothetical protein n=1 Tax=Sulfuricurvum sp. TaxID=2025608 RepID=UPI003BB1ADA0